MSLAAFAWMLGAAALAAPASDGAADPGSATPRAGEEAPAGPEALEALAGPVALYPDDLLAVVLRAAAHPMQILEAARYLDALEDAPSLPPDADWDDSVVALLNYPQVVATLSKDLDWTRELGRAVTTREDALLAAVERFRRDAHAAGNLASDRRQRVTVDAQAIEIRSAHPAVIYVPRYDPSLVRLRQATGVFQYYPRPCPVYYYPYPAGHELVSRRFWGVTSAFSIVWRSGQLQSHRLEHHGHPYFGHTYAFRHYRYFRSGLPYARYYRGLPHARPDSGERWRHDRDLRSTMMDRTRLERLDRTRLERRLDRPGHGAAGGPADRARRAFEHPSPPPAIQQPRQQPSAPAPDRPARGDGARRHPR